MLGHEDLTPQEKEVLERNVMVSLAGEICVKAIFEAGDLDGFEDDTSHVEEVIGWMFETPEDGEAYRASLSVRVKEMFEKAGILRAAAVFAQALLRNAEIDGEEAARIIEEAIADPSEGRAIPSQLPFPRYFSKGQAAMQRAGRPSPVVLSRALLYLSR